METIKIFLILSVFSLGICCGRAKDEKKEEQESINYIIDSITYENLELLKGVKIGVRKKGELVDRYYLTSGGISYHLPIFDSLKTKEKIMNPEWYNVVKFAKSKGVDSIYAYNYAKEYSDNLLLVYNKTGALEITNDSSLGDFIIFKYPSQEIIYLFPNGKIIHPFWIDFFKNTKQIKKGWFVKSPLS